MNTNMISTYEAHTKHAAPTLVCEITWPYTAPEMIVPAVATEGVSFGRGRLFIPIGECRECDEGNRVHDWLHYAEGSDELLLFSHRSLALTETLAK